MSNRRRSVWTSVDEELEKLRQVEEVPLDEALEITGEAVDKLSSMARELEEDGRFKEAANLYDKVAAAWTGIAERLPPEKQQAFGALADYWQQRSSATRRRARQVEEMAASLERQASFARRNSALQRPASNLFQPDDRTKTMRRPTGLQRPGGLDKGRIKRG